MQEPQQLKAQAENHENQAQQPPLAGWHYEGQAARAAVKRMRAIAGEADPKQLTSFRTDGSSAPIPAAQAVSPEKDETAQAAAQELAAAQAAAAVEAEENAAPLYRDKLPGEMRRRLSALDQEEARAQGRSAPDPEAGSSRFYAKAMASLRGDREKGSSFGTKARVYLIVAALFLCYYGYNEYLKPDPDPVSQLSGSMPLIIDAYTTMREVRQSADEVTLVIEQDPQALGVTSPEERELILDKIEANAPALCKNPQLRRIIASGKSLTVLLQGIDGSYERRYTLHSCPAS